ncbi:MAG: hypothetical protein KDN20_08160 [Verrucomicrobiae bacterium]|nr:hypothetical protein [Verrucomicrobiae bacterium]
MKIRIFGQTIWLLATIPFLVVTGLLLISTVTLAGFLIATGLLFFWFAIPELLEKRDVPSPFRPYFISAAGLGLIGLFIAGILAPREPSKPLNAPGLHSEYSGTARFHFWSPANWVPEIDQLLMGSRLFTAFDPFLDRTQSRQLRQTIRKVYASLKQDENFRDVPGELGQCYRHAFSGRAPQGHRYVYLPNDSPRKADDEKMPVVIFLHGSLGNFKGYLWLWKSLADNHRMAIVAPSFGIGEWRSSAGMSEVAATIRYCQSRPEFDSSRIFLAGISNGGAGVTHAAPNHGKEIAGLIYLSPVIDPELITEERYSPILKTTPVLVISGSADRRVPETYVQRGIDNLRSLPLSVEAHFIPDEDHFLFFSQPERVLGLIDDWLDQHIRIRP